jgi:YggT family protein
MIATASVLSDGGSYVVTAIYVYFAIIFGHLLLQMVFQLGWHPPYARWSSAALAFLHDVSDPYLRFFRRLIPAMGVVDLSPMLALIVLIVAAQIVGSATGAN